MATDKQYEYSIIKNDVFINLYQKDGRKHVVIIDKNKLNSFLNYEYSWHVGFHKGTNDYYVSATKYLGIIGGKPKYILVLLHDFLLDFPDAENIDHKNNNTLDNRLKNLRVSRVRNNLKNRKRKNLNNTSGYRNVSWILGYWRIQLQIEGKNHLFPEKFTDVDEAGEFAEKMRKKYYGEYAGNS